MNMQPTLEVDAEAIVATMGTGPIPAALYYREEFFALEREAIFKRCWLHIGHTCELPDAGSFIVRSLEVVNASVLITRGTNGDLRAFYNVCTHRGTRLVSMKAGKASQFTCRYHAWTFGNDGNLRSAPDFERFALEKDDCGLIPIAIDVCAGLIFINLAKPPEQTLREYLGALGDELEQLPVAKATTFCEYVYDIDANWKVTVDNFQENYHLRFIHPRTTVAGLGPDNPFGYPVKFGFHGPHRTETFWFNADAAMGPVETLAMQKGMDFVTEEGFADCAYAMEYYALFPNFMMQATPIRNFSHTVIPISATRSRGVFRLYWIGEDDSASKRFAREFGMASMRDIHCEDRSIIQAAQAGLSSGAIDHIHFQANEVLCRHLFYSVQGMVDAYQAGLRGRGG